MNNAELMQKRDTGSQLLFEVSNLTESMNDRLGATARYKLGQLENLFDELVEEVNSLQGRLETVSDELTDAQDYITLNL